MILYYWRGLEPNFGDELNRLLWPRLLPDFFDEGAEAYFLGIGSVLDDRHHKTAEKWVAGSGYGGYERAITLDETWKIHWVRGPRTARHLGLPHAVGLGDPASLLPLAGLMPAREGRDIGFIPHFESVFRGAWQEAAQLAGVTLIDPRDPPSKVIAAIGRCRVVMSEALHGVIVSDALRVPWIAIQPLAAIHRPKWADWADTLGLTVEFSRICPSSACERAHLSGLSRFHVGRALLHQQTERLRSIARGRFIREAAKALHTASRAEPQLSREKRLDEAQSRMMEAIVRLRDTARPGASRAASGPFRAHACAGARFAPTTETPPVTMD